MGKTINYYNEHAKAFYDRTINVDLTQNYQAFIKHLPQSASILDAGCGVGRDSKYFLSQGYQVTAFDASEEMVLAASRETGLNVALNTFQNISYDDEFDGVWAQASLLHIPYNETRAVYQKIHQALKSQGIFFASYKYGHEHMPTGERDFWNMDKTSILKYLDGLFSVIDIWTEKDTRSKVSASPDRMWLNFVVRKISE